MDFEIREATEKDLSSIMEIELSSFHSPWKKEDMLYELTSNQYSSMWVIEYNNSIIGFIDYWKTFDSATICQIAIDKNYRKQGLASRLLEEMIDDCYAKRVTNITLEVRKSNLDAIKLYEKFGFKKVLIKPHFYTDGEDAIYMLRKVEI